MVIELGMVGLLAIFLIVGMSFELLVNYLMES